MGELNKNKMHWAKKQKKKEKGVKGTASGRCLKSYKGMNVLVLDSRR